MKQLGMVNEHLVRYIQLKTSSFIVTTCIDVQSKFLCIKKTLSGTFIKSEKKAITITDPTKSLSERPKSLHC